jgi:hypothetical protein
MLGCVVALRAVRRTISVGDGSVGPYEIFAAISVRLAARLAEGS